MIAFTVPGEPVAKGRGSPKKATDQQILEAYKSLGSCWKVAEMFGMCGQSIQERLAKLGVEMKNKVFSEQEKKTLSERYNQHASNGTLAELAKEMGRTKFFICRQARELGLTDKGRKKPYLAEKSSINTKKWILENGHPRGALGMRHTKEAKEAISEKSLANWSKMTDEDKDARSLKILKTKEKNGTQLTERNNVSWKAGWRDIGGIPKYYRSRWEANYANYLQWLKEKGQILTWKHEPKTFWFGEIKRGCVSYLPDFLVTELDGTEAYHEVKGWMDDRSKTKIKRMAKYYPEVKLIVIDSKGYASLRKSVQGIVPGWEE